MIQTFLNALWSNDVKQVKDMLHTSAFFRDQDGKAYRKADDIVEKLLAYADYRASDPYTYATIHVIWLNENLCMKIKPTDNKVEKIYIRHVPKGLRRIRMDFSYDGSHYDGFQRQKGSIPSVQKSIENCLGHILQEKTVIVSAGRTDKGVHALHQVVHFDTFSPIPADKLKTLLLKMLPEDIVPSAVVDVPPVFHARYDVIKKTYLYRIIHENDPFKAHYAHLHKDPIDIDKLTALLDKLRGTHDFIGFSKISPGKPTVRTITDISAYQHDKETRIEIESSGFLRHMVRIIVGNALKDLNQGTDTIDAALKSPSKDNVKYIAPSNGLYLKSIYY